LNDVNLQAAFVYKCVYYLPLIYDKRNRKKQNNGMNGLSDNIVESHVLLIEKAIFILFLKSYKKAIFILF
jgi:hypothetical protein